MPIKYMDLSEFRQLGLLQEVNRLFFHPMGLALEVVEEDGKVVRFGGVWDCRDYPEGMMMETINMDKVSTVAKLKADRLEKRLALNADLGVEVFNNDGVQVNDWPADSR